MVIVRRRDIEQSQKQMIRWVEERRRRSEVEVQRQVNARSDI